MKDEDFLQNIREVVAWANEKAIDEDDFLSLCRHGLRDVKRLNEEEKKNLNQFLNAQRHNWLFQKFPTLPGKVVLEKDFIRLHYKKYG